MTKYIVEVEIEARDADEAREVVQYALDDEDAHTTSARLQDDRDTEQCFGCGAPLYVLVPGHHHTVNGKDVTRG